MGAAELGAYAEDRLAAALETTNTEAAHEAILGPDADGREGALSAARTVSVVARTLGDGEAAERRDAANVAGTLSSLIGAGVFPPANATANGTSPRAAAARGARARRCGAARRSLARAGAAGAATPPAAARTATSSTPSTPSRSAASAARSGEAPTEVASAEVSVASARRWVAAARGARRAGAAGVDLGGGEPVEATLAELNVELHGARLSTPTVRFEVMGSAGGGDFFVVLPHEPPLDLDAAAAALIRADCGNATDVAAAQAAADAPAAPAPTSRRSRDAPPTTTTPSTTTHVAGLRSVVWAFNVLSIMVTQAVMFWFAFPTGICDPDEPLGRDECLQMESIFGDGGKMCMFIDPPEVVEPGLDRCQLAPPGSAAITMRRVVLIFAACAIALPCQFLFELVFIRYACAPLKKAGDDDDDGEAYEDEDEARERREDGGLRVAGDVLLHRLGCRDPLTDDGDGDEGNALLSKKTPSARDWKEAFVAKTARVLETNMRVAAQWNARLAAVDDPAVKCRLCYQLLRYELLGKFERKIFELELAADGSFSDPHATPKPIAPPVTRFQRWGKKMTLAWWWFTLFFIFFNVFIVEPLRIFLMRVTLPSFITPKVLQAFDPTRFRLHFRTPLSVEASDLLDPDELALAFKGGGDFARLPGRLRAVAGHRAYLDERRPRRALARCSRGRGSSSRR
ncbi:hypothetical protein JL721_8451 [Aureococcus anophagefferens]|nr:hypothetical protein JL721_8451 [Aureococcus anophagefferens]